jgi:hypothetical protein
MKTALNENLLKAGDSVTFLRTELLRAHKIACEENPVMAMVILGIIADVAKAQTQLGQLITLLPKE